jgi:tetratricopeptide (TPR) repeat protein
MRFMQGLKRQADDQDPRRLHEQAWESFKQGGTLMGQGNLDEAAAKFDDALQTFHALGNTKGLAAVSLNLGVLAQKRGDLCRALEMLNSAARLFDEMADKAGMRVVLVKSVDVFDAAGRACHLRSDFARAEKMHLRALHIAEQLGLKEARADQYNGLGVVYLDGGDLARAEEMFHKSLTLNEELGRKVEVARQWGNLGTVYAAGGDVGRANDIHTAAMRLFQQLGHTEGIAIQCANMGSLACDQGDHGLAERLWRQALSYFEKLDRKEGVAKTYSNLGLLWERKGDRAAACTHWRKARDLWRVIGNPDMEAKMERLLRVASGARA